MLQAAPAGTLVYELLPRRTLIANAVLVLVGSGLIALSAQVSIRLPIGPVPLTGQTFGVLLIGALLGPRLGFMAAAAYVVEGIGGLPVYAGAASGWGVITGASGGYIVSFPAAAFVVGWLAQAGWDRRPATLALAMLIGNVVIYVVGLPWLSQVVLDRVIPNGQVFQWGLIPFIPGDLAKLVLAAAVVPSGWQLLQAARVGPERVLSGEPPRSANLVLPAVVAGLVLAAAAFLPWRAGDLGIEDRAGWIVLVAGLAGALGAALRYRAMVSAGVWQLWGFGAASLAGLVTFVNLIDFSADGGFELAEVSVGVPLAAVASIVLWAFAASEGPAAVDTGRDERVERPHAAPGR